MRINLPEAKYPQPRRPRAFPPRAGTAPRVAAWRRGCRRCFQSAARRRSLSLTNWKVPPRWRPTVTAATRRHHRRARPTSGLDRSDRVSGRLFTEAERRQPRAVIVVNENFAAALGRERIRSASASASFAESDRWTLAHRCRCGRPISCRISGSRSSHSPLIYLTYSKSAAPQAFLVARTTVPPATLGQAFRSGSAAAG